MRNMIVSAEMILSLLAARHSKDVFVPQCKNGPTRGSFGQMDAWAMRKSWTGFFTVGYEIKVRRGDFLGDDKWRKYLPSCHELYFAAPPGIIQPAELPAEVGLLVTSTNGKVLYTKRKATPRDIEFPAEVFIYILMWRAVICNENPNAKSRYWKEWLEDQEIDHFVGERVGKRLRIRIDEEVERARTENRILRDKIERLSAVKTVLGELGIDADHWFSTHDLRAKIQDMTEARTLRDSLDRIIQEAQTLRSMLTPVLDCGNPKSQMEGGR